MKRRHQVMSYGGGQQSVAMCVLIAKGMLPKPDLIAIADTGREPQSTWHYLDTYVRPLLAPLGLEVAVISHDLAAADLYAKSSVLIPAFSSQNGEGKLKNFCSDEWKTRVVQRWLRAQGVKRCDVWLGFSADEIERVKPSSLAWFHRVYPLLDGLLDRHVTWDRGTGLTLTRAECQQLVADFGLSIPQRSSCWMFPNRSNQQWLDLPAHEFQQAVELEAHLRQLDQHLYLHSDMKPLSEVDFSKKIVEGDDGCESGMCFV